VSWTTKEERMGQPVYKFFEGTFTEAWRQLAPEAQNAIFAQLTAKREEVGGKELVLCESSWANERVAFWGVELFPDIEAVQKLANFHAEIDWYRYVNSRTLLGTEFQPPAS
jgi:hypothetical protein